jgi:hypothetical protein
MDTMLVICVCFAPAGAVLATVCLPRQSERGTREGHSSVRSGPVIVAYIFAMKAYRRRIA